MVRHGYVALMEKARYAEWEHTIMMNVGILWDIENVRPPSNTNYIQNVLETVSQNGNISYAMAFGDWNKNTIKNIARDLFTNNFELIHIPKSGKNSADMSLIAHGVELIFQYPHIERFVLISGDGDFRPLLLTQKKHGKETWVICDVKNNASEDLLKMADKYLDYREIISSEETIENAEESDGSETPVTMTQAFELFKEAISIMLNEQKKPSFGSVKIKMKLLNNQFDETKLGFKSWTAFVKEALHHRDGGLGVAYHDNIFSLPEGQNDACTIPEVFQCLIEQIDSLDYGADWIPFTRIAQKINFKKYGYNRFKTLALDAEKRGYIETANSGLNWSLRRS